MSQSNITGLPERIAAQIPTGTGPDPLADRLALCARSVAERLVYVIGDPERFPSAHPMWSGANCKKKILLHCRPQSSHLASKQSSTRLTATSSKATIDEETT